MITDKIYIPLMQPERSVVWVWSCMTVLAPVLSRKWLRASGKAAHQLTSPHDCRWREGAQLLPELTLFLCLWLQERLAMAIPCCLTFLSTRKATIPLPFAQKTREPIVAPSLPFALSHSCKLSHGSVLCETWPRKRERECPLLCPLAFSVCQSTSFWDFKSYYFLNSICDSFL